MSVITEFVKRNLILKRRFDEGDSKLEGPTKEAEGSRSCPWPNRTDRMCPPSFIKHSICFWRPKSPVSAISLLDYLGRFVGIG